MPPVQDAQGQTRATHALAPNVRSNHDSALFSSLEATISFALKDEL